MPLLYRNITLAQQKMGKDAVNRGIVNILFKMLTVGPLLITNLKKPCLL